MRPVKLYVTNYCPYCTRAKEILRKEGVPFELIDVSGNDEQRRWLVQATGQRTVPQIFFGEESIGGCMDLEAIVRAGRLQARLG